MCSSSEKNYFFLSSSFPNFFFFLSPAVWATRSLFFHFHYSTHYICHLNFFVNVSSTGTEMIYLKYIYDHSSAMSLNQSNCNIPSRFFTLPIQPSFSLFSDINQLYWKTYNSRQCHVSFCLTFGISLFFFFSWLEYRYFPVEICSSSLILY